MLHLSLFTTRTDITIQGNFNNVDSSQTTRNTRSFNDIENANRTFIREAPRIEESTVLAPSADDPYRRSSNTTPHQCHKAPQTRPAEAPAARRTSTPSSNDVEHVYPPTPRSTRPLTFQRASYPYSNLPSEVDIPGFLGTGTPVGNTAATAPAAENLCQYVFNKIQG
ncbi:hypothetical protein BYT27DRAFT_6808438 [Phlegmacium glaucopus]|nr:hypothetical protein BYT27DRAFT_6808438 [Phlegmacium glaucopus]